ncbi:hypothetical protein D3C77_531300 [compost metagenome]
MNKLRLNFLLLLLIILPGCGIAEKVGDTVNFASDTTALMGTLTEFGQDIDTFATDTITDIQSREQLTSRLTALKEQVTSYAQLEVPEYASGLHQSIVQYTGSLQQDIDVAIANIDQGKVAFASTGIPDTINKINDLLNQISNLGL